MSWDYDWAHSSSPEECRMLREIFGNLNVLALDRERGLALVDAPWEGWFAPQVQAFKLEGIEGERQWKESNR